MFATTILFYCFLLVLLSTSGVSTLPNVNQNRSTKSDSESLKVVLKRCSGLCDIRSTYESGGNNRFINASSEKGGEIVVKVEVVGDIRKHIESSDDGSKTDLQLTAKEDFFKELITLMTVMQLATFTLEDNGNSTFLSTEDSTNSTALTGRKMSFMLNPLMFLPALIIWGFLPIAVAKLKFLVMNALMINNMALSSAIFMTLRNIVFGPRPGGQVKYVNYGYKKPNEFHHYHRRS